MVQSLSSGPIRTYGARAEIGEAMTCWVVLQCPVRTVISAVCKSGLVGDRLASSIGAGDEKLGGRRVL